MLLTVEAGRNWLAFLRTERLSLGKERPTGRFAIPWVAQTRQIAISRHSKGTGPFRAHSGLAIEKETGQQAVFKSSVDLLGSSAIVLDYRNLSFRIKSTRKTVAARLHGP